MSTSLKTSRSSPEWASAMVPGQWYRISGDTPDLGMPPTTFGTRYLIDNDTARDPSLNPPASLKERVRRLAGRDWVAPWRGRVGFSAITEAWNSAAYASRCGSSGAIIVFGGGHNNYFGSDVHAFDLATREWRRLTTGYITGKAHEYGEGATYPDAVYPDGSPLPPHTYDYVQYDEVGNDYILFKGQTELGPNVKAAAVPHLFNLDTLSWRRGPRNEAAILNSGGFTTWDAKRRLLWGHSGDDGGGNAFVAYSPDGSNPDGTTGSWGDLYPNKLAGQANHNAMQIDPNTGSILISVHSRNALVAVDSGNPGAAVTQVESLGSKPKLHEFAALEYANGMGSYIYYSALDAAAVYAIDWNGKAHWRQLSTVSGLNPIADAAAQSQFEVRQAHTFGRFRVAHFDEFDLALLVRHVDSPVYAMRLPNRAQQTL